MLFFKLYSILFLYGVVKANASMDIALHDSMINKKIFFEIDLILCSITNIGPFYLFQKKIEENTINNYIEPFFVGLLEGVGTITTDLGTSKKHIRVRIVISLKNEKNNQIMLNKIQEIIGGRVVIERQDKYVTWIASSQSDVNKVLLILARYPLLTIRKQCQLEFAKNCLLYKDFENFMLNRKNMYRNKKDILEILNNNNENKLPFYFKPWLSGFIEAEGNFNLVFNDKGYLRKSSFSIGQLDELHILNMIKYYFQSNNEIITDKKIISYRSKKLNSDYYRLSLYNAISRKLLFEHFNKYPLVTQKYLDFLLFKQCFEIIKNKEHLTDKGLLKIVGLKNNLNYGLSEKLKNTFPNHIPVKKIEYIFVGILAYPLDLKIKRLFCFHVFFTLLLELLPYLPMTLKLKSCFVFVTSMLHVSFTHFLLEFPYININNL